MSTQIIVCFGLCILTMVLYLWNPYKSLATTGIISVILLSQTGCLETSALVSNFGNTTGLLIAAMFVVAAGFSKTQFVKNMASLVSRISKGSLTKIMLGYIALAILMVQFIPSNLIPFCILAPMLSATVEEIGVKPSKVIFPLGLTCITTCQILPVGNGATSYASMTAQIANYGSDAVVQLLDPCKGRFPIIIVMFIFCSFFAWKLCPDEPVVAIRGVENNAAAKRALEREQMSQFHEIIALVIFFGTTVALILGTKIGLQNWQVAMISACLMIVSGVLSPKEASNAIPLWVWILYVSGLCMASALTSTGASQVLGDAVASIAGRGRSNILFYSIFFFGPYIVTQFILNRTAMQMFYPVVISTAISLGVSPVGGMICVQAGALSAFLTPMATGSVPYIMGAGGYDLKTLIKIGIVPFLLCAITSIVWLSIAFPVF